MEALLALFIFWSLLLNKHEGNVVSSYSKIFPTVISRWTKIISRWTNWSRYKLILSSLTLYLELHLHGRCHCLSSQLLASSMFCQGRCGDDHVTWHLPPFTGWHGKSGLESGPCTCGPNQYFSSSLCSTHFWLGHPHQCLLNIVVTSAARLITASATNNVVPMGSDTFKGLLVTRWSFKLLHQLSGILITMQDGCPL